MAPKYSISASPEEVIFGHSISYYWISQEISCANDHGLECSACGYNNYHHEILKEKYVGIVGLFFVVLATVEDKDTMQVSEMDKVVGFREVSTQKEPP